MMLSIMCALWVSSACAQIDIRNADKAIGTCRVEMMKAAREPNEFIFMSWCMQSHGSISISRAIAVRRLAEYIMRHPADAGLIWIHDTDGQEIMAFTAFGIETLKVLIADQPEAES
jgi:hypothetical protein